MPTPNANEPQKDFIARCIPIVLKEGTAKDQKQAAAICFSIWRRSKGHSMSKYIKCEDVQKMINSIEHMQDIIKNMNVD